MTIAGCDLAELSDKVFVDSMPQLKFLEGLTMQKLHNFDTIDDLQACTASRQ